MEKSQPPSSGDVPSDPPPAYTASSQEKGLTIPKQQQGRRAPPPALDLPVLKYMRSHRVILASASPRRRALLAQVGLPNLEVIPSTKPEDLSKDDLDAFEYVAATARQKALDVYETAVSKASEAIEAAAAAAGNSQTGEKGNKGSATKDPDLVIAADTVIVTRDGVIVEKPSSEQDHMRMLRRLRDTRSHRVLTSVCCVAPKADASFPGYAMASHTEETRVMFVDEKELSDDVIDSYVRTREGADKAGGYAIQGIGGMLLVEKIDGSVDNVVGLPVRQCLTLCEKVLFQQEDDSEAEGE